MCIHFNLQQNPYVQNGSVTLHYLQAHSYKEMVTCRIHIILVSMANYNLSSAFLIIVNLKIKYNTIIEFDIGGHGVLSTGEKCWLPSQRQSFISQCKA